jgi:hypothetical protein
MLQKFVGVVKLQLEYWKEQVAIFGPDHPRYRPAKITKYEYLIKDFTELLSYLEAQAAQEPVDNPGFFEQPRANFFARRRPAVAAPMVPGLPEPPKPATATADVPNDLADLPLELLSELSEGIKGETDQLIKIINGRGGTATLDEILIDLYRKYKEIGKRAIISNKLYRLSRRGLCWPIAGKKGIYTTTKPTDSDGSPPVEDDEGPNTGTPETSSGGSGTAKPAQSASSKTRRNLFASTAIPPSRVPH